MVSALGQLRSINRNGGQTTYVPVSASTALFPRYDQILVKTHYLMLSQVWLGMTASCLSTTRNVNNVNDDNGNDCGRQWRESTTSLMDDKNYSNNQYSRLLPGGRRLELETMVSGDNTFATAGRSNSWSTSTQHTRPVITSLSPHQYRELWTTNQMTHGPWVVFAAVILGKPHQLVPGSLAAALAVLTHHPCQNQSTEHNNRKQLQHYLPLTFIFETNWLCSPPQNLITACLMPNAEWVDQSQFLQPVTDD